MKATGIVRRIDDLGRVVCQKKLDGHFELEKVIQWKFFTNRDGEVILKKYSPIGEIDAFAKQYAEPGSSIRLLCCY